MKLTFNQLLADYLYNCINFKQKLSRDYLSQSDRIFIKGQIRQNLYDFQRVRDYLNDDRVFEHRQATKTEIKKYKIEGDYPVVGMFKYREISLPIYFDDYGEQEFLIYRNRELCGGGFEYFPEYYWMSQIDEYLEKDFFESNLDEPAGWKKLKTSCKKELEELSTKKRK